jgi:hypothetical protein
MISYTIIVSGVITILTKLSSILTTIANWKWKKKEREKTREDSKRVKKIVSDGNIEEINEIYFGSKR